MSVVTCLVVLATSVGSSLACPQSLKSVYADMHDGDEKLVTISDESVTIEPSSDSQKWTVSATLDRNHCDASVNFKVPGKPNPPPVNLLATFWTSVAVGAKKSTWEFTDPSGTLANESYPLNTWVELHPESQDEQSHPEAVCPTSFESVFADMHDGDKKFVTISGTKMTIEPRDNNQTWVVNAVIDPKACKASINFNVPGKPSPPPVALVSTLWTSFSVDLSGKLVSKATFEFTDPSGTLAAPDYPLNLWVQLGHATRRGGETLFS